ncbi:TcaA 3rd/4th domain-containing protein [Priestia megaterium]|uniref:TcaA 3rd/4th domain-containing protein n=1 Tax=Priestia megaterium TaxID=1404 RepID=UPI0030008034
MKKLFLILVPIIIVGAGVAYYFVSKQPKPNDLVKEFQNDVAESDVQSLMDLVEVDEGVKWKQEDATKIVNYLNKDKSQLNQQVAILNAQATYYDQKGSKKNNYIFEKYNANDVSSVGAFYIDEKKGILGKQYALKVRKYKLNIKAPKGAVVTIDGQKINMNNSTSKQLSSVGPTLYSVEGKKTFDFGTVKDNKEVILFDPTNFKDSIKLNLSGNAVTVNSSIPDTKLLLNGEKSKNDISKETNVSPIKDGTTLQGVVDFPWGEGKSKVVKIESNSNSKAYDLTPNPIFDKSIKVDVKTAINDFARNRMAARTKKDINQLKDVSDSIKKSYIEEIQNYDDNNYLEGQVLGTRIDFSKVEYKNEAGGSKVLVIPVEFHEKTTNVYEFADSISEEDFNEEILTLKYDKQNKKWIIESEDTDYNAEEGNYMTGKEVVQTTF